MWKPSNDRYFHHDFLSETLKVATNGEIKLVLRLGRGLGSHILTSQERERESHVTVFNTAALMSFRRRVQRIDGRDPVAELVSPRVAPTFFMDIGRIRDFASLRQPRGA